MVEKFVFWLSSIIEDDPIPSEIKNIVFNVVKNGEYKYLQLIGYEKYISNNSMCFMPLEAYYFDCKELAKLSDENFYLKSKYIIEEAFSNIILKNEFKNLNIYIKFNNKLELLFNV